MPWYLEPGEPNGHQRRGNTKCWDEGKGVVVVVLVVVVVVVVHVVVVVVVGG